MALPLARYIVLQHDGQWKINLDNRYYGPFATEMAAVANATESARNASAKGYPATVLLMKGDAFQTLWSGAPFQVGQNPPPEGT